MLVSEIITGPWKKHYPLFLHQVRAKLLNVLLETNTWKRDGTCFGRDPVEQMLVGCKEGDE